MRVFPPIHTARTKKAVDLRGPIRCSRTTPSTVSVWWNREVYQNQPVGNLCDACELCRFSLVCFSFALLLFICASNLVCRRFWHVLCLVFACRMRDARFLQAPTRGPGMGPKGPGPWAHAHSLFASLLGLPAPGTNYGDHGVYSSKIGDV